jgi:hypothetical protein
MPRDLTRIGPALSSLIDGVAEYVRLLTLAHGPLGGVIFLQQAWTVTLDDTLLNVQVQEPSAAIVSSWADESPGGISVTTTGLHEDVPDTVRVDPIVSPG